MPTGTEITRPAPEPTDRGRSARSGSSRRSSGSNTRTPALRNRWTVDRPRRPGRRKSRSLRGRDGNRAAPRSHGVRRSSAARRSRGAPRHGSKSPPRDLHLRVRLPRATPDWAHSPQGRWPPRPGPQMRTLSHAIACSCWSSPPLFRATAGALRRGASRIPARTGKPLAVPRRCPSWGLRGSRRCQSALRNTTRSFFSWSVN